MLAIKKIYSVKYSEFVKPHMYTYIFVGAIENLKIYTSAVQKVSSHIIQQVEAFMAGCLSGQPSYIK